MLSRAKEGINTPKNVGEMESLPAENLEKPYQKYLTKV